MRQGCPLSPLLYVLVSEVLSTQIHDAPEIIGFHLPGAGGLHFKISQYADEATINAVQGEAIVNTVPRGNDVGVPAVVSLVNTNVDTNIVPNTSSVSMQDTPDAGPTTNNLVNGESYAFRAARTSGLVDNALILPRRCSFANDMPKRPRTALFTPSRFTSSHSVFIALKSADIPATDIQCLQRKLNGEVVITFRSNALKEKFLALNSITINDGNYALQDIDRPLTYLTVYDAPLELSDFAIIKRLSPFCDVIHYRGGRFEHKPNVCNGLRHYRVRIIKPVPNFLRFGKYQVFIKYAGPPLTCRRCNQPGHFSKTCQNKVCFNCERLEHEANFCPAPPLCHFCKEEDHISRNCRYSWDSRPVHAQPTDESTHVNVDADDNGSDHNSVASNKTRSNDSFKWAEESDLSDAHNDKIENLPLAAAIPSVSQPSTAEPPVTSVDLSSPPAETPVLFTSPPTVPPDDDSPVPPDNLSDKPAPAPANLAPDDSAPDDLPSTDDPHPDDPSPEDTSSQHILNSDGLINPDVVVIDSSPDSSPVTPSSSSRISRRNPAPIPEALLAAGLRKSTSPSLVSGKQLSSSRASSPMEFSSDLKRKSQAQEKRKQKKGKK